MHIRLAAILICIGLSVSAETSDVPRQPNGETDVVAVMSSFKVARPITDVVDPPEFKGAILGKTFEAFYTLDPKLDEFSLTILSSDLSEEATYFASVLLADLICLDQNRGTSPVKWKDTSTKVENGWQVRSSCSALSR